MEDSKTNRNLYRMIVFILLMVVWMVFSGLFDAFHLTLGAISCGIVTWLSSDLLFENRQFGAGTRLAQGIMLFSYFMWMIWQIILANLYLLKLAFGPSDALQPQIVRYETSLKSDFEKFLLANSITLTPGTVTIKISGNTFYIHAISDEAAEGLDGEMERRIARVFAPPTNPSTSSAS
tara:strand:- start:912 stop:1445 length:534 start_codon:yes stop_codon:yes gene_type:complete